MVGKKTSEPLKQISAESSYTVIICGSGMIGEEGTLGPKQEGRVYKIKQKYSESPEKLFHVPCLSRRPERFYEFYREEILKKIPDMTSSVRALVRVEEDDKFQCIVTTNTLDLPEQVGYRNVIYFHGSIYKSRYSHCGRSHSMEEIRDSGYVPHCKNCKTMIRLGTSLCGEMVDSSITSRTARKIARADVLLVLGTSPQSEVYSSYARYFQGRRMVIIRRMPRPLNEKADVVIYDLPQNVLPLLVDGGIQGGRKYPPGALIAEWDRMGNQ